MNKFKNFLTADLKRNLLSITSIVCILGITALFMATSFPYYISAPAIYVYANRILGSSFIFPVIYMLASIPGAASYCLDSEHNFSIYSVIRGDIITYSWSKFLANVLSTFIVSFLALTLYCILLEIIFHNPTFPQEQIAGMTYHWRYYHNQPWLYYVVHNLLIAVSSVLWSTIALTISSFIKDRIVIFSLPIVANYLIERSSTMYLPYFLDLYSLSLGASGKYVSFPGNILYAVFLFSALTMLCGNLFVFQMYRRKKNGFS